MPRRLSTAAARARDLLRREASGVWRGFVALVKPRSGARQSLVALTLNSSTSFVAGGALAAFTGTFEDLPGLLMLVPAAIGLRGNVFSTLGSRLSTSIHVGLFRFTLRRQSLLRQNVAASMLLTMAMSFVLAVMAKLVAVGLGIPHTLPILDLAMISILGGTLASIAVLVATVLLAAGSVRYGWDLDNLIAPLVSTLGDVLTIPALWLAAHLVDHRALATGLGLALSIASGVGLVVGWASRQQVLRGVVRESAPILIAAAFLSTLAGVVIEKQLATFSELPALLILVPVFVSSAGALGGILSSRLATKLHLGTLGPEGWPGRAARADIAAIFLLAVPVYIFNAVGAHAAALVIDKPSPGMGSLIEVSLLGAVLAVAFVAAVAYYGTVAAVRVGVDPDTYGIPIVTSSVDFIGALALIIAIAAIGLR